MNERTRSPRSVGTPTTVQQQSGGARAGVKDGLRGMGFDAQVQMLTPVEGTGGKTGSASAGGGGPGGGGTLSPAGTLQHAVETEPSFFDRLFQRTVAGIETINNAVKKSDPDALLESFIDTVGTTITSFMSATPMGRLSLQFVRWSDELLQGHGTAKFGKAEYGNTDGKHLDEDDAVMPADPNARIDHSHDDLPSFGGPGGFEGMGEKKSLKDFLANMQTLYEDIDKALELAEQLGLLEKSESSERESEESEDSEESSKKTESAGTTTSSETKTDQTKLVDAKEDGSGNLTPSNGGGQLAVKGDGTVDNAPNLVDDPGATTPDNNKSASNNAGDKLGGATTTKPKTKPSGGDGGGLPKLSLEDVAQRGEWQPLNLDYQTSENIFEHTDDQDLQHRGEAHLDYWVWIATYPNGDYDIVAGYGFRPASGDGPPQQGSKLLERRKAGTPKPGGA